MSVFLATSFQPSFKLPFPHIFYIFWALFLKGPRGILCHISVSRLSSHGLKHDVDFFLVSCDVQIELEIKNKLSEISIQWGIRSKSWRKIKKEPVSLAIRGGLRSW